MAAGPGAAGLPPAGHDPGQPFGGTDLAGAFDGAADGAAAAALLQRAEAAEEAGAVRTAAHVRGRTSGSMDRSASRLRWAMLGLGVVILLGPFVAFDNAAGTQLAMRTYFNTPESIGENSTATETAAFAGFNRDFSTLYSAYSLPNVVMPLFGGVLTDRLGYRVMNIATTALALAGALIVMWGAFDKVRERGAQSRARRCDTPPCAAAPRRCPAQKVSSRN